MIIHYGYNDASGTYYVSIDAEKCNACKICLEQCPQKILTTDMVMLDLDDKEVAVVQDAYRKKIQFTCASCHQGNELPCVQSCKQGAIAATWQKK